MVKELKQTVQYYYDSHPTEEDLMGETSWHSTLVDYLKAVLLWLFREQACAIYDNLNFYQTRDSMEYPVAPDLVVIKDLEFRHMKSWASSRGDPVPQVVFEILSEETWKKDLVEKPRKYATLGVQEYFAYDPNEPPLRPRGEPRLKGWRMNPARREMVEIVPTSTGWLWSEQLESWLVPDQAYLRLYDRHQQVRLTGEEAQTQRAEAEAQRAEALAEKLRSLGINPEEIS